MTADERSLIALAGIVVALLLGAAAVVRLGLPGALVALLASWLVVVAIVNHGAR